MCSGKGFKVSVVGGWSLLLFFVLAAPALAVSGGILATSTADDAITAAAALGGALLGGGSTLLGVRKTLGAEAEAARDAQLRAARQQAADDIRALSDMGARLEKAVADLVAEAGTDPDARTEVIANAADVQVRLEFIWDAELREHMRRFTELALETATADQFGEVRERAFAAREQWTAAKARAGELWRSLMRQVVRQEDLLAA